MNDPGDQHDSQVNRAHVHNDWPKESGEFQGGAVVHQGESFAFRLAVFANHIGLAATEHKREDECLNRAENHEQEASAPEVELIDRTSGKAENTHKASQEGHGTRGGNGALAAKLQVIFAETDKRLDNRNGAGDTCDKEHRKPQRLEESAKGQLAEHERHSLEAEAEGTELRAFFNVVAGNKNCHRNHNRAAENDFGKAIGGTCR